MTVTISSKKKQRFLKRMLPCIIGSLENQLCIRLTKYIPYGVVIEQIFGLLGYTLLVASRRLSVTGSRSTTRTDPLMLLLF